jgi:hypothetical protein
MRKPYFAIILAGELGATRRVTMLAASAVVEVSDRLVVLSSTAGSLDSVRLRLSALGMTELGKAWRDAAGTAKIQEEALANRQRPSGIT